MPEMTRYEPGTFCWPELATTDAEGAKRFYGELFGWKANDMPMGDDGGAYTTLELRGLQAAALYAMRPEQQEAGVPPNWMPYVSVASADDTARRVQELGGKLLMEPFDVFDFGRMAVFQDPTGATFSVWQPKAHIGARVHGEPGAFCWNELDTRDTGKALEFYTSLFGWKAKPSKDYTEFTAPGASYPMGGMMQIAEEWGPVPPNWLTYFAVSDADATAAKAQKLGGKVFMPPTDIPNTGRFAMLQDPQGAMFAVIKLTQPGA